MTRAPARAPLLLALALVAGCGAAGEDGAARAAGAAAAPGAAPFKVALLSPGPISDAGWNAAAYEGLLAVRDQLGAEVAQLETRTPPEFEEGFREFAGRGFQLVFGHGFEFQDAAARVGAERPETVFITTSGSTVRPNVAPIVFRLEEATYLLGLLSGLLDPTAKAGVVGGLEIPSVASTFLAFEAGVRAAAPEMPVVRTYVGSWEDVSAAREAALAQVRQGVRFLFHNADAAGIGVLRAVEQATTPGRRLYAFGANKDQSAVAPGAVLASAVLDVPRAFVAVAREVKEGTFAPRVLELGMKDGVVSLAWNPALAAEVPEEVRARVAAAERDVREGRVAVPRGF